MLAWSKIRKRLFAPPDLHPEQVEQLLDHARRSGMDHTLHLLHMLEELHGHRRSAREHAVVDRDGAPLPWFTYPAIAYLDGLDLRETSVFEYGAGYGSWYFAARARQVISVEQDPAWHARAIGLGETTPIPTILLHEHEENYVNAVCTGTWDVIVIDGAWRRQCAQAALAHLAPTGFVILDNADRHPHAAADLRAADLLQVDFTGLGPINYYTWTTSFFMRRRVKLSPASLVQPLPGIGSLRRTIDE